MREAFDDRPQRLKRRRGGDGRERTDDDKNDVALLLRCRIGPLHGDKLIVVVEDTRAITGPGQDEAAKKSQIGNVGKGGDIEYGGA